jgi:hypothetical protein
MATLNDEVAAATAAATAKAAKLVSHHQHPVNKGRSPESRLGLKGKKYSPHDVLGPILDSMEAFHERQYKGRRFNQETNEWEAPKADAATVKMDADAAAAARAAAAMRAAAAHKAKKQRVAAQVPVAS